MVKSRVRTPTVMVLAVVLMMAAFACGSEEGESSSLVIGNLIDETGPLSSFAEAHRRAAELAGQHVNEAGGSVSLIHRDTGGDPAQGAEVARELVDSQNAAAILGALSSGVTIAVAQSVAVPDGHLQISPSATSHALTELEDRDFLFRTAVSDAAQGIVLATLANEQEYETAGIMFLNDVYGRGLADQFADTFQALGGTVTDKVPHEAEQTTYTSELERATAGNPDVLIAISYPPQAEIYLREAIRDGYAGKFMLVDGNKSPEMVEAIGGGALDGTFGTNAGSPETPALTAFKNSYTTAYGEPSDWAFLAETYDAAVLIALAAAKAGTNTDSEAIRNALRDVAGAPGKEVGAGPEGIREALTLIAEGKDIDYKGPSGSLNFDENGDVSGTIEIWKIEDDEIQSTGRFEFPYVPDQSKTGGPIAW